MIRQGHDLIEGRPRQPGQVECSDREQDRSGFSGSAFKAKFEARYGKIQNYALVYEPAELKVCAGRYLLEVPSDHPAFPTALRLRHLVDRFVSIYPDHVPPTSLIREFIGGSGFEY